MKTQKTVLIVLSVVLAAAVIVAIVLYSQNASLNSQVTNLNSQLTGLQSQLTTAKLNVNSSANYFDSQLHDLLQAHAFLLTETARRAPTSAAYAAALSELQQNINQVGALLLPIYGVNSSQLVNLWNQKTQIFINYSISRYNNDTNAMTYYNTAEAAYVPQVVTFWTTTTNSYPVLSQAVIQPLATQHMIYIKGAIDDWYAGNYTAYYNDLSNAYDQMGVYADTIAQAIIQQNPQDFQ